MKIVINYMSCFFRGKLKIVLKDVAKQSAQQKTKKSGKKKQQPGSKKQSSKNKCVTKYKKNRKNPKRRRGKVLILYQQVNSTMNQIHQLKK